MEAVGCRGYDSDFSTFIRSLRIGIDVQLGQAVSFLAGQSTSATGVPTLTRRADGGKR